MDDRKSRRRKLADRAWRYADSFSFVGLVFATLFFSASVTPSLLPRTYVVQGILSGFAIAAGYAVGVAAVAIYRFLDLPIPSESKQSIAQKITTVIVAIVFLVFLQRMTFWQNSIRELMEMPKLESAYPIHAAGIALVSAAVLVAIGRIVIACAWWVADRSQKVLPRKLALTFGFFVVVAISLVIGNGIIARSLLNFADATFLQADARTDKGIVQPSQSQKCGSPESLVPWNTIGRRGKNFIAAGPTKAEIQTFYDSTDDKNSRGDKNSREAMEPIRVYIGKRSKKSVQERASLALEELKRVDGFDRSVLIVATPTGTGWLDPSAVDTIEYLHGGDTAIVSTQYSYLPSWITILIDPERSIRSATALFEQVYAHWKTLPKDDRPKLYLHGLSLGSLGSEVSTSLYRVFEDPIHGAVWSGPPFPSSQWSSITARRNPGTPAWLPEFDDGRLVRFTSQANTLDTDRDWGPIRNVYVQYASDPMVFFSPDLMWRRPDWLDGDGSEGRGPDVSPHLRWYPVVTFLQIAFDLPMATTVPIGHGHSYAPQHYIDAWIAVTDPPNWEPVQTEMLKMAFQ